MHTATDNPQVAAMLRQMDARAMREEQAGVAYRSLRDGFAVAWLAGNTQALLATPNSLSGDQHTLSSLIADELVDLPGNSLHDVIQIVARAAAAGDKQAVKVIESMSEAYADDWVDEIEVVEDGDARFGELEG